MVSKRFIKAFIAPALVFIIHLIFDKTQLYLTYEWLDIPMHLAGGFAIALMISSLLKIAEDKKMLKINNPLRFLFIISFVALIAIFWEFYEFILDYINATIPNQELRFTDTIKDFFFGLIGAIFGYLFSRKAQ